MPRVVIQDLGAVGVQAAARERVLETKFPRQDVNGGAYALHRDAGVPEGGERVRLCQPDERNRRVTRAFRLDRSDDRPARSRSVPGSPPLVPVGPCGQGRRRNREIASGLSDAVQRTCRTGPRPSSTPPASDLAAVQIRPHRASSDRAIHGRNAGNQGSRVFLASAICSPGHLRRGGRVLKLILLGPMVDGPRGPVAEGVVEADLRRNCGASSRSTRSARRTSFRRSSRCSGRVTAESSTSVPRLPGYRFRLWRQSGRARRLSPRSPTRCGWNSPPGISPSSLSILAARTPPSSGRPRPPPRARSPALIRRRSLYGDQLAPSQDGGEAEAGPVAPVAKTIVGYDPSATRTAATADDHHVTG